jgi:Fur family ferric uptake transcriptional regulator
MRTMDKTNALREYLRHRGLKVTRQREEIAQIFLGSPHHLSAEELYRQIRETHPEMGLSTVYRTLKLLVESGLVSRREFGDGITRYESVTGGGHHDHLICVNCGIIIEFENQKIEELQNEVAEKSDFTVLRHKLELYGYCRKCRRR